MQFHTFILIVVLQLIAPALADFYVYMVSFLARQV